MSNACQAGIGGQLLNTALTALSPFAGNGEAGPQHNRYVRSKTQRREHSNAISFREIIEVGDSVTIEHGVTPGVVHDVVESIGSMTEWGLKNPGVMVEAAPFGLVFWPIPSNDEHEHDPLVFVSRKLK